MSDWPSEHRPQVPWAPRGLPRWLNAAPGWAARVASESRFAGEILQFELSLLHGSSKPSRGLPQGNARPVLVIPGFGFGDAATLPVQIALHGAGYRVVRSRIWVNIRCSDRAVDALGRVAAAAVERDHGRPLFVVGHSRGGMLARGLAARFPELVERVVSLGAPLNHEFAFYEIPEPMVRVLTEVHHLDPDLRRMQCSTPECTCPYMLATRKPLPPEVELISIHTKADGIVDWRACVVPGAINIEVPGTHLGMGLRPSTTRVVLEALALPPAPAATAAGA